MNDSQRKVLQFIRDYRLEHGISSTYRIISEGVKLSIGGVQHHTAQLQISGYLTHIEGRAASFVPTNKEIE